MRILFMGNNWVAWQIISYLSERNENVVGLVVHPKHKQRYGEELIGTAKMANSKIFDGSRLKERDTFQAIKDLQPDIGLSILFDYLFYSDFINLFPKGIVNLHPSYLPYNRGQYPNVWSIVEDTPAGVTLHYIDEGIDTGDIIAQKEVQVSLKDTGESLYRKLESISVELFGEYWPLISQGKQPRISQSQEQGSYHITKDVEEIDEINLDGTYVAADLINILRARTFPPYRGAYFWDGNKKIYIRLQLLEEDEL